jgi:monoamine oxidase
MNPPPTDASSDPKRVVVVGAGFAGLSAAYHLGMIGHDVTILETQSRIGGRAITIRRPLAAGLLAEAGPARFLPEFERVSGFARQFDLELVPFYPDSGTVVAYLGGRRIEAYEPRPEEFWGYASIVSRYPGVIERNGLRLALKLRNLARRLLGRPPWRTYRVRGGIDQLADALATATQAEVRLETTVESITQSNDERGVEIEFAGPEGAGSVAADYVVCAVPLSVLGRLRFSPALPPAKADLITAIPFASAIRIFLQMRRPYWRDQGHNGFAVTDTLGEIWDPHFDAPCEPALLVCYAKGTLADRLGSLDEAARLRYAVAELEHILPGAAEHFQVGTSYCWREQPWIRGGWPLVREGFEHQVSVFRKPEGRLYFAGDYAAAPRWLNMLEGAIESGEHVASLIDEARAKALAHSP